LPVLVFGLAMLALLGGSGRATSGAAPQFLILQSVGAFSYPVYATAPPGDQDRLFVVQLGGVIKLVLDGIVQPTPFLDASGWITSGGSRGCSRWPSLPTTRRAAASTSTTRPPAPVR
jgi:hypothetical protein